MLLVSEKGAILSQHLLVLANHRSITPNGEVTGTLPLPRSRAVFLIRLLEP